MRGRKLAIGAFLLVMFGMIGPSALAGDNHSDVFTFATSSTGSRLITLHTPPTFAASNILSGTGDVSTTTPATTQVTEVAASGANWTVTAQICGPASQSTITETAALTAGSDCTGANGNQFAGYNTSSGAYLTSIAGSRVTAASTLTNAGTAVPPFLAGTATTTSSSTMSAPVTVLNAGSSESGNKSYSATYAATTGLTVASVNDNATWVGYWVTTLQP